MSFFILFASFFADTFSKACVKSENFPLFSYWPQTAAALGASSVFGPSIVLAKYLSACFSIPHICLALLSTASRLSAVRSNMLGQQRRIENSYFSLVYVR